MGEDYKRAGKADLSGMDRNQLADFLKPHYKTDEDLSVENLKWFLGFPLLIVALVVCVVGSIWLLLTIL